jgi:hypothetical protein
MLCRKGIKTTDDSVGYRRCNAALPRVKGKSAAKRRT